MFYFKNSKIRREYETEDKREVAPYFISLVIVLRLFEAVGIVSNLEDVTNDMEMWGFDKVKNIPRSENQ
jgi:hypothetical protein